MDHNPTRVSSAESYDSILLYFFCYRSGMLNAINDWLNSKPELKVDRRSCDATLLEPDEITELELRVEQFMRKNKRGRYVALRVKPFHLYLVSVRSFYEIYY